MTYLLLVVTKMYFDEIEDCTTAREAWNKLEGQLTNQGTSLTLDLLGEHFELKKKEDERIVD